MARPLIPRDYVVAQALELLSELGLQARADRNRDARSVLGALHHAVQDPSLDAGTGALLRAEASLVAGRLGAARRTLEEVVASPGTSDAVRGLALDRQGDLRWWAGDYRGAAGLYRRSLSFRPDDQRTRKDLARALFHTGDPGDVIDVFGADSARRVDTRPGESERAPTPDGVHEVNGLYVSDHGAGIMVVQGCAETEPGMVVTGSLGTVAHEACDLAWSIWRRRSASHGHGVRIHATRAAVTKDGPSLGLAVWVLFGEILGRVQADPSDAFTGELDLRGHVQAIGGIRDKALAAYLSGLRRLFLPKANVAEIEEGFRDILELRPVEHVDEVAGVLS